jgi:hypothetical protein
MHATEQFSTESSKSGMGIAAVTDDRAESYVDHEIELIFPDR